MTVTMSMSPDFHYDYDDGYGGKFDWTLRMDPYTVYKALHCLWAY